jgi:hypothetical protein
MKPARHLDESTDRLVQQFAALAVRQDIALLEQDIKEVNRIYWKLEAIEEELKARPGDQRAALMKLYEHENMQVRVKAAKATLAVAPQAARAQLEAIVESKWQPYAGEAGMSLLNLDRGIFKPE